MHAFNRHIGIILHAATIQAFALQSAVCKCLILDRVTSICVLSVLAVTQSIHAQDVNPAGQYKGLASCVGCHNVSDVALNVYPRDFVPLTESKRFLTEDKHRLAFELLQGDLGQHIGKRMWDKENNKQGIDVTKSQICLSCHANWWQDQPQPPPIFNFGVTCESCHGPSSLWEQDHKELAWRVLTPDEKFKKGYVDVRHPVRRAEQCFSCHIGNSEQGKVVTHEMYAAGHPPLPSIEIESFIDQMPSHWRYLPEKGSFESRAEYVKVNYPHAEHDAGTDLPRTRGAVVGGMVALRESLELFAKQAQPDNPQWPELALFDCQACHHDLRTPSWRQQRETSFAPGRPTLPEWPFALAKLGLRQVAGADDKQFEKLLDQFNAQRTKLNATIRKQPFGDKQAGVQAAEFAKWLEPHIATLASGRYDTEAAKRAVVQLSTLGEKEFPDFHSARQITWALGIIQREVQTPYPDLSEPLPTAAAARRALEAKNIATFEKWRDEAFSPQRALWAKRWQQQDPPFDLPLLLPSGQKQVIEQDLKRSLEAISNYDAAEFRRLLMKKP